LEPGRWKVEAGAGSAAAAEAVGVGVGDGGFVAQWAVSDVALFWARVRDCPEQEDVAVLPAASDGVNVAATSVSVARAADAQTSFFRHRAGMSFFNVFP
jgi:hypothetical protein